MSDHDHEDGLDPESQRLSVRAQQGCEESRLLFSRRALLGMGIGLFTSALLPRPALAGSVADPRFLLILLRGGMDGLNVAVPTGADYQKYLDYRQGIAFTDKMQLNDIGEAEFMLHPALTTLRQMYLDKEAAIVPATCVPLRTRSHFDCQDNLENGLPGLGASTTGWLNRALGVLPSTSPIRIGSGLAIAEAPIVLRGPVPTLGWSLNWLQDMDATSVAAVKAMYASRDKGMSGMLARGLKAHAIATKDPDNVSDGNSQNLSTLQKGFRGAARLMKDNAGPRVAVITVDNFDTHSGQGLYDGFLWGRLAALDAGLADFKNLIGADVWANTVVCAISEFGRNVKINGTAGTDHGVGGTALLTGGAVNGGKIFGGWPGLTNLHDGKDLKVTVDARRIFKGILKDHFGISETKLATTVFPSSTAASLKPLQDLLKPSGAKQVTDVGDATASTVQTFGASNRDAIAAYRAAKAAGAFSNG